jgi:hypothetical protein
MPGVTLAVHNQMTNCAKLGPKMRTRSSLHGRKVSNLPSFKNHRRPAGEATLAGHWAKGPVTIRFPSPAPIVVFQLLTLIATGCNAKWEKFLRNPPMCADVSEHRRRSRELLMNRLSDSHDNTRYLNRRDVHRELGEVQ